MEYFNHWFLVAGAYEIKFKSKHGDIKKIFPKPHRFNPSTSNIHTQKKSPVLFQPVWLADMPAMPAGGWGSPSHRAPQVESQNTLLNGPTRITKSNPQVKGRYRDWARDFGIINTLLWPAELITRSERKWSGLRNCWGFRSSFRQFFDADKNRNPTVNGFKRVQEGLKALHRCLEQQFGLNKKRKFCSF